MCTRRNGPMCGCPFYGNRWPEVSLNMQNVGGNECGLDIALRRQCHMQAAGISVNFFTCDFANSLQAILASAEDRISFPRAEEAPITLRQWKSAAPTL